MYAASFESILKTILIIMMIYFGFKLLMKWFGPMILKYFLKRLGSKFQQQFTQQAPGKSQQKGDVVIDKKPKNSRKANKKVGEYIDYEEID